MPSTRTPALHPDLLLEAEACALLGMSVRAARRLRSSGDGPPWQKIAGHVYYSRSGIERWLAAGFAETEKPPDVEVEVGPEIVIEKRGPGRAGRLVGHKTKNQRG